MLQCMKVPVPLLSTLCLVAIAVSPGTGSSEEQKSHQYYVDRLKDRLQYAYIKAEIEAGKKGI